MAVPTWGNIRDELDISIAAAVDAPTLGADQDGFMLIWDNDSQSFVASGSLYLSGVLDGPAADEKNAIYVNMPTVANEIARGVNVVMDWSGTNGATGYNLFGNVSGSGNHDHYYGNQNWIFHDSTGTTTRAAAFMGKLEQDGGTITHWYGLYLPSNTLTSGSVTNSWNIYAVNAGRSYLRGGLILSDELITPSSNQSATAGVLRVVHDHAVVSGGLSKYGALILSSDTAAVGAGGVIALGGESGAASTPYPFGFILGAKEAAGETYNGYLAFYTTDTGSNNSEKVRITSAGNVGIGTTQPTAALHLPASTTTRATLNIPSGTAPTAPVNGDIWSDGTDLLVRLGGTTYTLTKS